MVQATNPTEITDRSDTRAPVFVDDSGRRRRRFRRGGRVLAVGFTAYALLVLVGLTGHPPLGDIRLPFLDEHATPRGEQPRRTSGPDSSSGSTPDASATNERGVEAWSAGAPIAGTGPGDANSATGAATTNTPGTTTGRGVVAPTTGGNQPPDPTVNPPVTPSTDAPGHDALGPGKSETAAGHDVAGPGTSETAPGRTRVTPTTGGNPNAIVDG